MLSPRPGLSPRDFTAAPFSPFAPLSASSVTFLPLSLSLSLSISRGMVDVVALFHVACTNETNSLMHPDMDEERLS